MSASHIIAPESDAYVRDLSIAAVGASRHVVVWVEDDSRPRIAWRVISPSAIGPVHRVVSVCGEPSVPQISGQHLVWCEMTQQGARLAHLFLDSALEPQGAPHAIPALEEGRHDRPVSGVDSEGRLLVLAECWQSAGSALCLACLTDGHWEVDARFPASGFCVRPRLVADRDGVMASWDRYGDGRYRVVTAVRMGDEWTERELPAPDDSWETLSTLASDGDGTWYIARCRERLVELDGGICSHHSRLIVSSLRPSDSDWQDLGGVDIDFAMNPWMAAYCGLRRFPSLVPDEDGVWLLWEEKEDVTAMDPPSGRLCAVHLGDGAPGSPVVAVSGQSHFVVADGGRPDELAVISRTRPERFVEKYPARLHWVDLIASHPSRPTDIESNALASPLAVPDPRRDGRPDEAGLQLFFGDPHLHSRVSQDLNGEQDELYHFARDVAGLDFVAFCENDFHHFAERMPEVDWLRNCRNAEAFNEPGRFTAFQAWEFTGMKHPVTETGSDSHRCVIFPDAASEIVHWYRDGRALAAPDLARHFSGQRVLLHHHHPSGYDISDDSIERNIEICSGWWNCMGIDRFVEALHRLLASGLRLGFIGASDNHERNPGLGGAVTGVWAAENTRESVFDALWNRRVFATTGIRPELRFQVADAFMGGETHTDVPPQIRVHVLCDRPIERITIVRDGVLVRAEDFQAESAELLWQDTTCTPGRHYYYAHVRFAGTEANPYWNCASAVGVNAWTSPVWVQFGEAEGE